MWRSVPDAWSRSGVRWDGTYTDVVKAPLTESRNRGRLELRKSLAQRRSVRVLNIDVNGVYYSKGKEDLIFENLRSHFTWWVVFDELLYAAIS